MRTSDFYAYCLAGSTLGLVWLILGGPGVLCCIAAMIIGQLDVSWIDDLLEKQSAEPQPNVVYLPSPPVDVIDSDVQLADVDVTPRKWHTTVPVGTLVKRPSLFKQVQKRARKRKVMSNVISFPRKVV